MRCLVTGTGGFIGSHLSEALVKEGHSVLGIDVMLNEPIYPRSIKEGNLVTVHKQPNFKLVVADLVDLNLVDILKAEKIEWVFHLAGLAGVRASWGQNFDPYVRNNIISTQRLLEAVKIVPVKKFIYASSSSVYGEAEKHPTPETARPQPLSPYGVTKLAGENLTMLYAKNFGVPVVALRFFSVYGPRQRPDMAFAKFIKAMQQNQFIPVYGDGKQTRDFTFVGDIVRGNLLAAHSKVQGEIFNIGGGSRVILNNVFKLLEKYMGFPPKLEYHDVQAGDPKHNSADITKAQDLLGYLPSVGLEEGLRQQVYAT